jgi:hypothetical protein
MARPQLVGELGLLPLQVGFAVFTLLGLAVLALGSWRAAGWTGATSAQRLMATVLMLTAWPTVMAAIRGQSTLAVAGLLSLSVAGSGVALGLAALKPTLLPVWGIWLVLTRRWRTLLVALGVVLVLALLSLVVVSPQAVLAYPAHLLGVGGPDALGVHPEQMINWRGVAERVGGGPALIVVGTVATLVVVAIAWWRSRSSLVAAAVAFIATPLVVPHANQHEAVLAEVGVLLLIAALSAARARLVIAAVLTHAALWAGPVLQAQSAEASAWLLFAFVLAWLLVAGWLAMAKPQTAEQA